MSVPGVAMITVATFLAQVGEIDRFATSKQLVGYLGLDPRVRQSGNGVAFTGRISKEGRSSSATSWSSPRTRRSARPGRCGPFMSEFALVAGTRSRSTARKMVGLFWHLLTRGEDYRHALELPTKKKLRKVERLTGAEPRQGGGPSKGLNREQRLESDRARARVAEEEYRSLVTARARF